MVIVCSQENYKRRIERPGAMTAARPAASPLSSTLPAAGNTAKLGQSKRPQLTLRSLAPASPPSGGESIDYEKILAIFSAPHTPDLAEKRFASAVDRVARANVGGAAIRDLPFIERLLLLVYAFTRKTGSTALDQSLCSLIWCASWTSTCPSYLALRPDCVQSTNCKSAPWYAGHGRMNYHAETGRDYVAHAHYG